MVSRFSVTVETEDLREGGRGVDEGSIGRERMDVNLEKGAAWSWMERKEVTVRKADE